MEKHDLVIIGEGCAGLSAGIYASGAGIETLILDKGPPGGRTELAESILDYPGIPDISGPELVLRMLRQAEAFGAVTRTAKISCVSLAGEPKTLVTDSGTIAAKSVIIAAGTFPAHGGFEGESEFQGRGVSCCAARDGRLFRGKDIFVTGSGNAAAEAALYLTHFGKSVTVLVRDGSLGCSRAAEQRLLRAPMVSVRYGAALMRVYGDGATQGLVIRVLRTGKEQTLEPDGGFGVFVYAGREPDSSLFRGQISLDENGYIITDELMRTGLPGVFAAGDIRRKPLRRIATAVSDGAVAAAGAEKFITGGA